VSIPIAVWQYAAGTEFDVLPNILKKQVDVFV
jgi:hypothetical protein